MDVAYGFLHTEVSFPKEGTEFVGGTHQGPYFWSINPSLLPLSVAYKRHLERQALFYHCQPIVARIQNLSK